MKEHIAHSGAWGIALTVIMFASWFLYRYLAPKTWREWAGADVILLAYVRLARSEERRMLDQFGEE